MRPRFILSIIFLLWHRAAADHSNDRDDDKPRTRDHIEQILLRELPATDDSSDGSRRNSIPKNHDQFHEKEQQVLRQLRDIYHKKIRPVENQFHYADLKRHVLTDADISAKPIVLMVGPWSTGKSTIINYIGLDYDGLITSPRPKGQFMCFPNELLCSFAPDHFRGA